MPELQLMQKVFLSVGSNIEPEKNITSALDLLSSQVEVTAISTFYKTEPINRPGQPPFINGVWEIATNILPRPLKFDLLYGIESRLGRIRTEDKYAPRTIDLDILLYGDQVIQEPDLRIPDPDLYRRPFLAIALLELAPQLLLPDCRVPLAELDVLHQKAEMFPVEGFTQRLNERLDS